MSPLLLFSVLGLSIAGACAPAEVPKRRLIDRAAEEAIDLEYAVGPFRFHLPPGFRNVEDARLDDLREGLSGLDATIPDAIGVFAPVRAGSDPVRLFESEKARYRILFRAGPANEPASADEIQIEHKVWWSMGLEDGRFRPTEIVAELVEIAGQPTVHTAVRRARETGGLKVWDVLTASGRRHTIAIQYAEQEDDRGGRIEAFLRSLRVEPGVGLADP